MVILSYSGESLCKQMAQKNRLIAMAAATQYQHSGYGHRSENSAVCQRGLVRRAGDFCVRERLSLVGGAPVCFSRRGERPTTERNMECCANGKDELRIRSTFRNANEPLTIYDERERLRQNKSRETQR